MKKLPPISTKPGRERVAKPAAGRDKRVKEVKAKHAQMGIPDESVDGAAHYEAEMTEQELQREAEKHVEHQASPLYDERVKEEKELRAKELEKEEGEQEKDRPTAAAQQRPTDRKKPFLPEISRKKAEDGFEKKQPALHSKQAEKLAPSAPVSLPNPVVAPRPDKPQDPMALLNLAQPPGIYIREDSPENPMPTLQNRELLEAVEEARRLLRDVSGIERISPGLSEADEPAVLVVAMRGFGEASLAQIPSHVRQFPTTLALPYDLLPLKKERLIQP